MLIHNTINILYTIYIFQQHFIKDIINLTVKCVQRPQYLKTIAKQPSKHRANHDLRQLYCF